MIREGRGREWRGGSGMKEEREEGGSVEWVEGGGRKERRGASEGEKLS